MLDREVLSELSQRQQSVLSKEKGPPCKYHGHGAGLGRLWSGECSRGRAEILYDGRAEGLGLRFIVDSSASFIFAMDKSDVGFRHSVAFSSLTVNHNVDLSPSAVAVARELRISIIAIVLGIAGISIVNSVLSSRRSSK